MINSIKGELFHSIVGDHMRNEKSAMTELVYEHYRNFYVDRESDNHREMEKNILLKTIQHTSNDIKLTKANETTAFSSKWQAI